jgi:hypothetical protein
MSRPTKLKFKIGVGSDVTGTATAVLLWDKAPQTCTAIIAACPISTWSWHGRNSGDEALLCLDSLITHVPQDETENASQVHRMNDVMFGYEAEGFCYGGAGGAASEIAWIYGHAACAQYWVSDHGPPHDKPPYKRETANLNVFATIIEEDGFYTISKRMARYGQQRIEVTCE